MTELVGSAVHNGDDTYHLTFRNYYYRRDAMGIPVAVCYDEPFDSFDLNKLSHARPTTFEETSQYIIVWWSGGIIDLLGDASMSSGNVLR